MKVKVWIVKEKLLLSCHSWALVSMEQLEHPSSNRHGYPHNDTLTHTYTHAGERE